MKVRCISNPKEYNDHRNMSHFTNGNVYTVEDNRIVDDLCIRWEWSTDISKVGKFEVVEDTNMGLKDLIEKAEVNIKPGKMIVKYDREKVYTKPAPVEIAGCNHCNTKPDDGNYNTWLMVSSASMSAHEMLRICPKCAPDALQALKKQEKYKKDPWQTEYDNIPDAD